MPHDNKKGERRYKKKKRTYTFTLHFFQVLEQATLSYGGRNSGFLRGQRRGLTGKGKEEIF